MDKVRGWAPEDFPNSGVLHPRSPAFFSPLCFPRRLIKRKQGDGTHGTAGSERSGPGVWHPQGPLRRAVRTAFCLRVFNGRTEFFKKVQTNFFKEIGYWIGEKEMPPCSFSPLLSLEEVIHHKQSKLGTANCRRQKRCGGNLTRSKAETIDRLIVRAPD